MANFQTQYGKKVMQIEFGGPSGDPHGTRASLAAYIRGVKGFGGLGVFFWESEGYAPFTNYRPRPNISA